MDTVHEESDGQSSGSRRHSTSKSAKGEFRMSDSLRHSSTDDSVRACWDTSRAGRVPRDVQLCATVARQSSSFEKLLDATAPKDRLADVSAAAALPSVGEITNRKGLEQRLALSMLHPPPATL